MSLLTIFIGKTNEEKLHSFCEILNKKRDVHSQYTDIQETFLKSKMGESSMTEGTDITCQLVGLCNESARLNKSLERMERSNPHLLKSMQSLRDIDFIRTQYSEGNVSKSVLFDTFKAKQGQIKFADVIVTNDEGEILILSRINQNGSRDGVGLPGGHVDLGESCLIAAKRELFEETFLDVDVTSLRHVGTYDTPGVYIEYFEVCIPNCDLNEIILDSSEHSNYEWVRKEEIHKQDFVFNMRENLQQIFEQRTFVTDVVHIKDETKDLKAVDIIVKGYAEGWISQEMFAEFVSKNKSSIEKANKMSSTTSSKEETVEESGDDNEEEIEKTVTMEEQGQVLAKESLEGEVKNLKKSTDVEKSLFGVEVKFADIEGAELFKSLVEQWAKEDKLQLEEVTTTTSIKKSKSNNEDVKAQTLSLTNKIEGCKTRLQNIHWTEENNSKHIYIDELKTSLSEFEDKFAEVIQASLGRFADGELQGEVIELDDPIAIIELLLEEIELIRETLEGLDGEISIVDDFMATLKQSKYRLEME